MSATIELKESALPPLCLHLGIAREAAARSNHPVVERNLGNYLLGSTLPDVHIISGIPRVESHLFDLEKEHSESGVKLLFEAHPYLAKGTGLGEAASVLVAGYLSHLITDEIWIIDIYRPYFGPSSPLADDPMANIMDRVLQYELDIRERLDRAKMSEIRQQLERWNSEIDPRFVDPYTLRQWWWFMLDVTERKPDWSLFPHFAERFLVTRQKVDPKGLEQFLNSMPEMLERVIQYVTPERIVEFREKAINESAALAEEYLN